MSPADFWYVLVKRSFFQNMKNKKLWLHLNTLKPGPESIKINTVCQPNWLNICHYGFWKYYILAFSEAFGGCSYVCPILSHLHQIIKSYGHLKFYSAKFGSAFYQLLKLLYLGNRKRSESEILAASSTHGSLRHITKWAKFKTMMDFPGIFVAAIALRRWIFLKNRPIHFHINRTTVIRPVKWNQLSFPSIEINKPLLTPVYSVS